MLQPSEVALGASGDVSSSFGSRMSSRGGGVPSMPEAQSKTLRKEAGISALCPMLRAQLSILLVVPSLTFSRFHHPDYCHKCIYM